MCCSLAEASQRYVYGFLRYGSRVRRYRVARLGNCLWIYRMPLAGVDYWLEAVIREKEATTTDDRALVMLEDTPETRELVLSRRLGDILEETVDEPLELVAVRAEKGSLRLVNLFEYISPRCVADPDCWASPCHRIASCYYRSVVVVLCRMGYGDEALGRLLAQMYRSRRNRPVNIVRSAVVAFLV